MTCKKCETILKVTGMKGDGPLACWKTDVLRDFVDLDVTGHNDLYHWEIQGGKHVKVPGVRVHVFYDDGTLDGMTIDPVTGEPIPPNPIGTFTLDSLGKVDGKCPREYPGGEGDCYAVNSLKECDSTLLLSWTWKDTTQGNRYGMGITYGNWKFRDCHNPGPGDSAFSETGDDYWKGLMTVPPASAAAREGSRKFSNTTCGHVFMWRIHFYDEHDGTDRAGIEDNYFEITVGCEGCCTKIQLEE